MTEKQVQNLILLTFGTRHDMRLWRANTGLGCLRDFRYHPFMWPSANQQDQTPSGDHNGRGAAFFH